MCGEKFYVWSFGLNSKTFINLTFWYYLQLKNTVMLEKVQINEIHHICKALSPGLQKLDT